MRPCHPSTIVRRLAPTRARWLPPASAVGGLPRETTTSIVASTGAVEQPPDPPQALRTVHLPALPSSAKAARALVRESCTAMDESAREVAVLLTSELVTNALRHAAPPIDITSVAMAAASTSRSPTAIATDPSCDHLRPRPTAAEGCSS